MAYITRINRILAVLLLTAVLAGCGGLATTRQYERNNKLYVIGAANKQVMVDWVPGMTVMQLLSHAEFPHPDAMTSWVTWVDKSGPVIEKRRFSYSAIVKGSANDFLVHPGDIIYLRRNPIYAILDGIERFFQPIASIFRPAAAAATAGGTESGAATQ